MYLDPQPMMTAAVEFLTTQSYSQRQSFKTGMFWVIEVFPTTVTNDEDSICSTVSIDQATTSPAAKATPTEAIGTGGNETDAEREEGPAVDNQLKEEGVTNAPRYYTLDCILHYGGKGDNVKYVIH